jgi:hypothetical protein
MVKDDEILISFGGKQYHSAHHVCQIPQLSLIKTNFMIIQMADPAAGTKEAVPPDSSFICLIKLAVIKSREGKQARIRTYKSANRC